jgi:hypothetical protein
MVDALIQKMDRTIRKDKVRTAGMSGFESKGNVPVVRVMDGIGPTITAWTIPGHSGLITRVPINGDDCGGGAVAAPRPGPLFLIAKITVLFYQGFANHDGVRKSVRYGGKVDF